MYQLKNLENIRDWLTTETDDFDCSYRLDALYVKEKKQQLNIDNQDKGNLPLIHHPGEGQGDFGDAEFYENGRSCFGKYFVISDSV